MDTPVWNFNSTLDVYEPAEDTFLLLDALETDLNNIRDIFPTVVLEIGSGSGVIISALAKALKNTAICLAIDINYKACKVTQETALMNSAQVDVIQGDLTSFIRKDSLVDLLVFNPPYVVTSDDEISGCIQRSWAGGAQGRAVINRLLDQLGSLLSPKALFYLVVIRENNPQEIINMLKVRGFVGNQVAYRKVRGEQLSVLKFVRS